MSEPRPPAPRLLPAGIFTQWFDHRLRWRLVGALLACVALPAGVAAVAKTFVIEGVHGQAERTRMLIDFMATGACVFGLSMVLTWLVGAWVVAVMKGPQHLGDAFPEPGHLPSAADDPSR
jgi:hypothetical protein